MTKTSTAATTEPLDNEPPAAKQLVVLCNCPDESVAAKLASQLLQQRLAACVNSMPVTSRYRWENELLCEQEVTLIIKTTAQRYKRVEAFLNEAHPYEVPEIIALPISIGLPAYLQWLTDETTDAKPTPEIQTGTTGAVE